MNDEMAAGNEKKSLVEKFQPRRCRPPFTIFPFPQKVSANSYSNGSYINAILEIWKNSC